MSTDKLTQFLADHLSEDPAKLAASLRAEFDIRDKAPAAHKEAPPLAIGQTWRNRSTDRLVRITDLPGTQRVNDYNGATYRDDRVHWEALTGRGPKTGAVFGSGWDRKFDYVEG